MIITTGSHVEGYEIVEYLDVIYVEKIIGIGIATSVKSLGDMFNSFTGEEYHAISDRISELKQSIKVDLINKAFLLGADAIIGIDYETTIPDMAAILVSINGTAVKLRKLEPKEDIDYVKLNALLSNQYQEMVLAKRPGVLAKYNELKAELDAIDRETSEAMRSVADIKQKYDAVQIEISESEEKIQKLTSDINKLQKFGKSAGAASKIEEMSRQASELNSVVEQKKEVRDSLAAEMKSLREVHAEKYRLQKEKKATFAEFEKSL